MHRVFPQIRIYSPEGLMDQLKLAADQALANTKLAGSKGQVQLPAIFDLYEEDFIRVEGHADTLQFVKEHISAAQAAKHAKLFAAAYTIGERHV